jgi:hypothetical protein
VSVEIGPSLFAERSRPAAVAALLFLVLNVTLAGLLVAAAYGWDLAVFNTPGRLIERGAQVGGLLRLAMLVDMIGYLAVVPVALYLHRPLAAAVSERVRRLAVPSMLTAAGVGFSIVGALGAAFFGSVAPLLLDQSATETNALAAARLQLGTIEQSVFVGLWGMLELPLLAIWMTGITYIARAEGRLFTFLGGVSGLGLFGYALRCALSGQTPFVLAGLVDYLILATIGALPIWILWVAYRLWHAPSAN